jgi:DNA repair photolyase
MRAKQPQISAKRFGITSGTREWADHNINCVLGCYNNCRYCYAKIMAKRFGRATDKTWQNMKVRQGVTKRSYKKMQGRVMFPTSHDIIDIPVIEEACFTTLMKLLKSGNDVLITTKPRYGIITRIDKLFSHFKRQMQFRFTITSASDELLKFWEPNAPSFKERIESLKYIFAKKYKTSVSIEPFLDYNPTNLVKKVLPYSTESVWIGKMNYIPQTKIRVSDRTFYEDIRKNYEIDHLTEIYDDFQNYRKLRFKDSIKNVMVRVRPR